MPEDQNRLQVPADSGPKAEAKSSVARLAAISMIGLGAASCASIEFVQRMAPELGALPGLAASCLALCGLLLLLRCQVRQARQRAALRRRVLRLSPYVPVMEDGSNGIDALAAILAPAGEVTSAPPRRRTVATASAVARAPGRRSAGADASVTLFHHSPDVTPATHRGRAPAAIYSAMRMGGEWSEDIDLSPRAIARLEADPFVQRLARIG